MSSGRIFFHFPVQNGHNGKVANFEMNHLNHDQIKVDEISRKQTFPHKFPKTDNIQLLLTSALRINVQILRENFAVDFFP